MFSAATKTGSQPSAAANYIEDVFSTYLYAGNGSTQTINNGIDLAGEGGMTWIKARNIAYNNVVFDTTRGVLNSLRTNQTAAQSTDADSLTAFNSTGFSLGSAALENSGSGNFVSWTFREQPKFFDVVTYTGTSSTTQSISHSLGSVPGFILIKCTSNVGNWLTVANSSAGYEFLRLNTTSGSLASDSNKSDIATSTNLNVGWLSSNWDDANTSGETYVAYLFAHNAGGFGLSGTDNVISCGSMTFGGSGIESFNLGYEPQYLLIKKTDGAQAWWLFDTMRGMSHTDGLGLRPSATNAETNFGVDGVYPTATGFDIQTGNFGAGNFIYMAIRRPMKVPTDATTVFKPVTTTISGSVPTLITTGFPVDLTIDQNRGGNYAAWFDRLRGSSQTSGVRLNSSSTAAETALTYAMGLDNNTGYYDNYNLNAFGGGTYAYWNFSRRPGFFDEVCYTGTGSATTVAHNLGVAPEMMIVKQRNTTRSWPIYSAPTGNTQYLFLNTSNAVDSSVNLWQNTTPTASVFSIDTSAFVNQSGSTYVAYLFATCPGVSKVGSYTGTGTPQVIDCGFTGGARFVLIKRTDSTSNWFVWDTARGMVAGTDPSLSLNTTAAEVNANSAYTATTGFSLLASPSADVNTSGGSYIFLAIS